MISTITSCGLMGVDGYLIDVEVDMSAGLPGFDIVGLPDVAVRESRERVKSAIKNCGFKLPVRRITINLAPAHIKKEGAYLDLPIAIAILEASEQIVNDDMDKYMFIGELSLTGELRPVNGVLPIAITAFKSGINKIILPKENAYEAAVIKGLQVLPAANLFDIISHLNNDNLLESFNIDIDKLFATTGKYDVDFSEVKGQENVKRALEIAAAGGHNILMIGPPGSGKTMIAKRLPTILPDMSFDESLEVSKIHSIAGLLPHKQSLISTRPFRSPHHTISNSSLVGGGRVPTPGEISLAHFGVLFLDELPEFKKDALEVMRQPLEDGLVTISRVTATLTYPCNCMLVASMNPCKCGYYGDDKHECICSPHQVQQYLNKISGPLLDRIDLHIEVAGVKYKHLESEGKSESSASIKKRVNKARNIQLERYKDLKIFSNAQLNTKYMNTYCKLGSEEKKLLKMAFNNLGLSARAHSRILKVARTIADLDDSGDINSNHIAEAIQYRSLDRKFWS